MESRRSKKIPEKTHRDQKELEDRLIIVDTDVIIDFFRGTSPGADVLAKLISLGKASLTSISVFELYSGIEGTKRLREIEPLVPSKGVRY